MPASLYLPDASIACNAFGIQRTVEPTIEPVTVAEAKVSARVQQSAEDTEWAEKITAARERCETNTLRALLTQRWRLTLDRFPWGGYRPRIPLFRPPLISVVSVKYYDTNLVLQTLDPSAYRVLTGKEPGCIEPVAYYWPYTAYYRAENVEIIYEAGYGTTADKVPATLRTAIKRLALAWMEEREESEMQEKVQTAFDLLCVPFKHCFDFGGAFE